MPALPLDEAGKYVAGAYVVFFTLIVPLLLLPLVVPVLISAASATEPLLRGDQAAEDLGRWLGLLSLYDVVFVLIAVAVFDFLLDD